MIRLKAIAKNTALGISVAVSAISCCLWTSTRWTDVRLDHRTAFSRFVFASVHGVFHFQWHDEPGRVAPHPTIGYDWRFDKRSLNWQFLNPYAAAKATTMYSLPRSGRKPTWFVSFPMPMITCFFGFTAVALYRRNRNRDRGDHASDVRPAISVVANDSAP